MGPRAIAVLWMDDRAEVYANAETHVTDGVLHIHQYTSITRTLTDEHHLPLCNIRDWYPADQDER
jgi:hypothetical protein